MKENVNQHKDSSIIWRIIYAIRGLPAENAQSSPMDPSVIIQTPRVGPGLPDESYLPKVRVPNPKNKHTKNGS